MTHPNCQPSHLRLILDQDHYSSMPKTPADIQSNNTSSGIEPSENDLDVALMLRVAGGEEAAFEQLIERHQGAIIGTVSKMLGNAASSPPVCRSC